MKRCRFCGGEIKPDAVKCKHCGKVLRKVTEDTSEAGGLTDLRLWEGLRVPAWLTYLLVAICLFCVYVMLAQGCERASEKEEEVGVLEYPESRVAIEMYRNSSTWNHRMGESETFVLQLD